MKRALLTLGFVALVTTQAAAQWLGEPVWNSPKGGTGLTISGDYAAPNSDYGKGHTWGGRAALGLGTMTFTLGVANWKPEGAIESFTSIGGNAAFRLIGGSLLPVAVNLQIGAAHTDSAKLSSLISVPARTRVIGAVGFSVPLPTPGVSIEPFFSPGLRYTHFSNSAFTNQTQFGYAIGANVSFGTLGVHFAYDNEKQKNGPSVGVFGIGAHLDIRLPLGM
jgi:hypothetical protein